MLVLDTCALLHLAQGRAFRPQARDLLEAAVQRRQALVPAIAALEIAQKVWSGGLHLPVAPAAWFAQALRESRLRELPLSAAAAFGAYTLPEPFHRDPADRLIVAAARRLSAPLLTSDRKILAYAAAGHVQAIPY
jgi:PIN domain nuclease of toxin-antitoxin system